MALEPIPVVRAVYLNALLEVLRESGKSFETELARFDLPESPPDEPNIHLPLNPVLSFARCAAVETAVEDLGLRAGSRIRINDLEAGLRLGLLGAPSLQSALRVLCRLAVHEQAPSRYRMCRDGDEVRISCTPAESSRSTADNFGEWLRIMVVVAIVRRFAGEDWTPTSIGFRSSGPPGLHARGLFPRTLFLTGESETSVAFPASLLRLTAMRCQRTDTSDRAVQGRRGGSVPTVWDFPASLRAVLRAYLDEGRPSIELAARISGTTVRTLQRRLAQLNLTFSDILEEVRFDAAKRLLRDRDVKVTDAAYALGYSDPAHFTRAFRRMAGVNPRRYRAERIAA